MATVFVAIGIALILYVGYRLYQHLFPPPNINVNGKYVLISGCDTGFGHALAIELDKQGFHVLAGVYNPDNEEHVTSQLSTRATVFCLDITQQEEIDAAYNMVKEKTSTLHALVNNAGIWKGSLIDWTSVDVMRKMMDVNFFGHVIMTKKFLPLLISRRGSRVINICSFAGYLAGPSQSAYAASKFALEAFSDCLRREMSAWGLYVSVIEPGYMRTPIIEGHEHVYRDLWSGLDDETRKRWGDNFFHNFIAHSTKNPFMLNAENPRKVVQALRHAVINSAPRIRYRPGWQSSLFFFPLSMLPSWIADFILIKTRAMDISPAGLLEQQG
jgi:NAD(P)-dependent dehydrogenase (short-subunit alcohol dehydrogenase family)